MMQNSVEDDVRNGCEHKGRSDMTNNVQIFDETQRIQLSGMTPEKFVEAFNGCVQILVHLPSKTAVGVARVDEEDQLFDEFSRKFPDLAESEEDFMIECGPAVLPEEIVHAESVQNRGAHRPGPARS